MIWLPTTLLGIEQAASIILRARKTSLAASLSVFPPSVEIHSAWKVLVNAQPTRSKDSQLYLSPRAQLRVAVSYKFFFLLMEHRPMKPVQSPLD